MPSKSESPANSRALERRRVLYLLGEAVEKLLRMRAILARQRAFVEANSKKPEYAGVIDPLLGELEDQAFVLTRNSPRIASFLRNEKLDEKEEEALPGILQKVIDVVLGLHEVLILLPRETVEPQVFQVLRDCFAQEWKDSSVILTNELTAYEYRIEDILENLKGLGQHGLKRWRRILKGFTRAGSVLAQAFVDRDNPLAWPVLAHEYGHALDEIEGISRQIVHGDPTPHESSENKPDFKVKWASEIFADFVAARVLGAASQIPILLIEIGRPLATPSDEQSSHPPTTVRLKLVRAYLKDLDVSTDGFEGVFGLYDFDYERKLAGLDEGKRKARRKLEKIADDVQPYINAIASKVNSLNLLPFGRQQLSHAHKLQAKLQSDLPISSFCHTQDNQILLKLNSLLDSRADPERVYEVLSAFNEAPATSSEILTAGWLYKLATFEEHLQKSFPEAGSPKTADLDLYGEYLARTDELLLRSVEIAAVHAAIIRA
jgi:hypothetical protein